MQEHSTALAFFAAHNSSCLTWPQVALRLSIRWKPPAN